jgi:hypothetical protein
VSRYRLTPQHGAKGGTVVRDRYGQAHYSRMGERGGATILVRYGKAHYSRMGRKGAAKRSRLLTWEQVNLIREAYLAGESRGDLARRFGVSRRTLGRALVELTEDLDLDSPLAPFSLDPS